MKKNPHNTLSKDVLKELKSDNISLYLCLLFTPKSYTQEYLLSYALYAKLIKIMRLNADPTIISFRLKWWHNSILECHNNLNVPILKLLNNHDNQQQLTKRYSDIFTHALEYILSSGDKRNTLLYNVFSPLFLDNIPITKNLAHHQEIITLCTKNYSAFCLGPQKDTSLREQTILHIRWLYHHRKITKKMCHFLLLHFISLDTRNYFITLFRLFIKR